MIGLFRLQHCNLHARLLGAPLAASVRYFRQTVNRHTTEQPQCLCYNHRTHARSVIIHYACFGQGAREHWSRILLGIPRARIWTFRDGRKYCSDDGVDGLCYWRVNQHRHREEATNRMFNNTLQNTEKSYCLCSSFMLRLCNTQYGKSSVKWNWNKSFNTCAQVCNILYTPPALEAGSRKPVAVVIIAVVVWY